MQYRVHKKDTNLTHLQGFTLVELLTVIAIIGIVASLVLPALSTAKFQAKQTTCKNNLHQLGEAMEIYTGNYHAYPLFRAYLDWANVLEWDQLLEKEMSPERNVVPFTFTGKPDCFYTRSRTHPSFQCPLLATIWPADKQRNLLPDGSRYGYNATGIAGLSYAVDHRSLGLFGTFGDLDDRRPTSASDSDVVAPSDMTAFGDPFTRSLNPEKDGLQQPDDWRPSPNIPLPDPYWGVLKQRKAAAKMHRGKINKSFCDGHVEVENFNKPFIDSDEYLRRWNIDNQPHREVWDNYPK